MNASSFKTFFTDKLCQNNIHVCLSKESFDTRNKEKIQYTSLIISFDMQVTTLTNSMHIMYR